MSKKIILAAFAVFLFLTGFIYKQYQEINNLEADKVQIKTELKTAKDDLSNLFLQYEKIDQALTSIAESKRLSDEKVNTLQKELKDAQAGNACFAVRVPDSVNDRLRARVAESNAAATAARDATETVSNP